MSSLKRQTDMFARAEAHKKALAVGGVVTRTFIKKKGKKKGQKIERVVTRYTKEYVDLQEKLLRRKARRAYDRVMRSVSHQQENH
ncbi:MAG TPA: hypothetical protein VF766_12960 [Pyrinomonadaceae bacterium]